MTEKMRETFERISREKLYHNLKSDKQRIEEFERKIDEDAYITKCVQGYLCGAIEELTADVQRLKNLCARNLRTDGSGELKC